MYNDQNMPGVYGPSRDRGQIALRSSLCNTPQMDACNSYLEKSYIRRHENCVAWYPIHNSLFITRHTRHTFGTLPVPIVRSRLTLHTSANPLSLPHLLERVPNTSHEDKKTHFIRQDPIPMTAPSSHPYLDKGLDGLTCCAGATKLVCTPPT